MYEGRGKRQGLAWGRVSSRLNITVPVLDEEVNQYGGPPSAGRPVRTFFFCLSGLRACLPACLVRYSDGIWWSKSRWRLVLLLSVAGLMVWPRLRDERGGCAVGRALPDVPPRRRFGEEVHCWHLPSNGWCARLQEEAKARSRSGFMPAPC